MGLDFTLFVDESGDAGITKVSDGNSPGSSPYMVLGAVLVDSAHAKSLLSKLKSLSSEFRKPLHCSRLKHEMKVRFAREVAEVPVVCFGVISKKSTLGWYGNQINQDHSRYYHKCAQYLLEIVVAFMIERGIEKENLSVCMEQGPFNASPF